MSRQKIIIGLVLVTFALGGLATLFGGGPPKRPVQTTSAASLGGEEAAAAVWARLAKLRAWLPTFDEAFKDATPEPQTVLAAFAVLAEKVAGPSGFWRDTVPNELLECHKSEQPVCRKLNEALPELSDGEAFARSIGRLDKSRASLFLSRNAAQMVLWLDVFAPNEPTLQGMRATSFWEQKLAPAIAGQD